MQPILESFSIRVRPITYPEDDNKMFNSFSLGILDKRPVKGPKEIFLSFSLGILDENIEYNEPKFIRVK